MPVTKRYALYRKFKIAGKSKCGNAHNTKCGYSPKILSSSMKISERCTSNVLICYM